MNKITGFEILNQVDDKNCKIYVEMCDTNFKIILLGPAMEPLSGEMNTEDINYFSSELSISFNEYLEQTQKIFSGQEKTVYFFIKDYTFEWKKNVWTLGKIELYPITDISFVWKSFQKLLQIYQSTEDKASTLEEENKNLTEANKELTSKVEKMIEIKTAMEEDLYKKFTCILNSKKKKIKELEDSMKKMQVEYKIYNATTDESEGSEEEYIDVENYIEKSIKTNKRKSLDSSSSECLQKASKINNAVSNNETICKPSTSKDYESSITVEEKVKKEESCSSEHRNLNSGLNCFEESPEEDLFSLSQ